MENGCRVVDVLRLLDRIGNDLCLRLPGRSDYGNAGGVIDDCGKSYGDDKPLLRYLDAPKVLGGGCLRLIVGRRKPGRGVEIGAAYSGPALLRVANFSAVDEERLFRVEMKPPYVEPVYIEIKAVVLVGVDRIEFIFTTSFMKYSGVFPVGRLTTPPGFCCTHSRKRSAVIVPNFSTVWAEGSTGWERFIKSCFIIRCFRSILS